MNVLIYDWDEVLVDKIINYVNSCRTKMQFKRLENEKEIFKEEDSLYKYSLFIINLKDPLNSRALNLIKSNSNAPVLLILDKGIDYEILKDIYYHAYDDIVTKDFPPQELAFRIYKLCNLWNEDNFYISKDSYFNFERSLFFHDNKPIKLGRKESLLLKFLLMKSSHIVSVDKIIEYVYLDEIATQERVRSLVRELRAKIPIKLIKTVKGEGYGIY